MENRKPKLVIIFGPQACGKMTVGKALSKKTGLKLFHNHQTIEALLPVFDFGSPEFQRLNTEFRKRVFEEAAQSHDLKGLIFTFVWDFSGDIDKRYIDSACKIFSDLGHDYCFVELETDLEERLLRNKGEDRLKEKASKRNIERTERMLLKDYESLRLNSNKDFFYPEKHIKINNTKLSPDEVVDIIVERFF